MNGIAHLVGWAEACRIEAVAGEAVAGEAAAAGDTAVEGHIGAV